MLTVRAGVDTSLTGIEDEAGLEARQQHRGPKEPRPKRKKPPPPPSPNHFLALQVSQQAEVVDAISQVHASIQQHSPHLKKACVEAASAHLTLGVMALNSEEDRQRAAEALEALAAPLAELQLLAPFELRLEGLSHFKNQVLYLDIHQDDGLQQLMQLAAATRSHFHQAGLLQQAEQQFVPHVTIAKTSKLQGGRGWGKGSKRGGGGRGGGGGGHDWRQERRSKQQRLEQEQEAVEEGLLMGFGLEVAGGEAERKANSAAVPAGSVSVDATAGASSTAAAAGEELRGADSPSAEGAVAAALEGRVAAVGNTAAAAASVPSTSPQEQQDKTAEQQEQVEGGKHWRCIPAEAWAPHVEISGGKVLLTEIQLCVMQGRKNGGYYPVICSLPLTSTQPNSAAEHTSSVAAEQPVEHQQAAGNPE